MTKNKDTRPVGRPRIVTKEVLAKLQEAFLNSATDEEACLIAGISTSALYDYQNERPEFLEEKNLLKQDTSYRSRTNIVKAIREGNLQQSNWWSERKNKAEFSVRQELTGADGKDVGVVILPVKEINEDTLETPTETSPGSGE